MSTRYTFEDLAAIMDRLREPGGCPWDREQDFSTLRGYLLEECYEVVEALDGEDYPALCEELGDLLFQIVFLARIAKERGRFDAAEIVRGIAEKMIRRHPHVFGNARADTSDDVLRNWEQIKREEKASAPAASVLSGVPRGLPALLKAQRLGTKAARVGFDWEADEDLMRKIEEELDELRSGVENGDPESVREEIGDVLFSLAMLARRRGVDPEAALESANRKFTRRFHAIEARLGESGVAVEDAGLDRLDALWNEVKSVERSGGADQASTPIRRKRS